MRWCEGGAGCGGVREERGENGRRGEVAHRKDGVYIIHCLIIEPWFLHGLEQGSASFARGSSRASRSQERSLEMLLVALA